MSKKSLVEFQIGVYFYVRLKTYCGGGENFMNSEELKAQMIFSEGFDDSEQGANLKINNPTLSIPINNSELPINFSVIVMLFRLDYRKSHDLKIKIEDQNGTIVTKIEGKIPAIEKPKPGGLNVNINFTNVFFKKAGWHTAILNIDDAFIAKQEIHVNFLNENRKKEL